MSQRMVDSEQILYYLTSNKERFKRDYHLVRIGVFGSVARGEQSDHSDIDLIVEFEENTQDLYDLKIQLKEFFHIQLGIGVDICREKYIKPRFRSSILKETVYAY